jgi:hypothetical protein
MSTNRTNLLFWNKLSCAVLQQEGTLVITRPLLLQLASNLHKCQVDVQRPVAE